MKKLAGLVVALVLVHGAVGAPPSTAAEPGDELPPEQDNGAAGRRDMLNQGDVPPSEACNTEPASPGGSRLVRRLAAGPTAEDGTLLFTSGSCIYVPSGYETSDLRYPVLYLLHGGGGDAADWVNFGAMQATMDAAGGGVIVVMPDGSNGLWYDSPDGSLKNETYVIDWLIPFVDRHYRTIADRRGRAVAGLSNGGLGAMVLSAKHPDRFVAATSMSGNLGGYAHDYDQLNRPAYHDGNTPTPLASNLDEVELSVRWGARCEPTGDLLRDACGSWGFEQLFRYDNQLFDATLTGLDHDHVYVEDEGSHAWRWWSAWLRDHDLPFVLDHLDDPEPGGSGQRLATPVPATFRYKSISSAFSIWGYDIGVDRNDEEMLELTNVTADGLTVTGSGIATIVTAPRYQPNAWFVVGDEEIRADHAGRLAFSVELGDEPATRDVAIRSRAR